MATLHAAQTDYSVQIIQALGGGYQPGLPAPNVSAVAADANYPSLIHHRS